MTLSEKLVRNTSCPIRRETLSPGPSSSAHNKVSSWLCPRTRRRTTYWLSSLGTFTKQPGSTSTITKQRGILPLIWRTNLWPLPNGKKGSRTRPSRIQAAPCWQKTASGEWHRNVLWMLSLFVRYRKVSCPLQVLFWWICFYCL